MLPPESNSLKPPGPSPTVTVAPLGITLAGGYPHFLSLEDPALPITSTETYLTLEEVADFLSVHPNTVRKAIHRHEIEVLRIGRTIRIREAALIDYLHAKSEPPLKRSREAGRGPAA